MPANLVLVMRRTLLCLFLTLPLLAALAPSAEARCARIDLSTEATRARYVFEGTVVSVSGTRLTFAVTAVWKGNPPAEVTVSRSRRGWGASASDVGRTFLILATGESDTTLSFHRCGSSRLLEGATVLTTELAALGLTRTAR